MTRLSSVLAGLALGAIVAPALAQDITPVSTLKYAKYDMATHRCTILPGNPDIVDSDPTVLFDNATTNGSFTTNSGGVKVNHMMDWGTFTTTNGQGATITEFRMAYATNVLAPGAVAFRVRFYDGATGNGNKGTVNPNGDLLITGLPNSVSGGFEGYLIDVTLVTPITLNDGPIGWSYNSDSSGSTTGTGPLLAGPPNAPGVGPAHVAPAVGFGSYDRYTEATDVYAGTSFGAGPVMISLTMRLKGRENGLPPSAWSNYGEKNKVTLTGEGSATPGSVDNNIQVKCNPAGKNFILVAGITQADFFQSSLALQFYAFPWIVQLAPITTPALNGTVNLPVEFPVDTPVGLNIYMQAFAQNLSNSYKNWSEGLQVTIQ
jgi:hypothetical protein